MERVLRLFIDIDGTITSHALKNKSEIKDWGLKEGADEFFDFVTKNFDCYWLSNWVPRGSMFNFNKNVMPLLPESATQVQPAYFENLKTEAISDGDFLWLDDSLLTKEKQYLEEHNWLDRFIPVDKNATNMAPVIAEIKKRMHQGPTGVDV